MALNTAKPFKPKTKKKCRNTDCACAFLPERRLQSTCSIRCGLVLARKQREKRAHEKAKRERVEDRQAREKVKPIGYFAGKAQEAFNAYVRELDFDEPCRSCGKHHRGQYHAGHYLSVGSCPELRFELLNVWKQCMPCNNHKSSNAILYRAALVAKLGQETVEWLEGPHEPKRYRVEDYKAIAIDYRAKTRELVRARERGEPRDRTSIQAND